MSGITDLGAQAAVESDPDTNADVETEYERYDLAQVDGFGRQHPATAVVGEAVALRSMYDENDLDRSDVSVILQNPSIVTSEDSLAQSVVVEDDSESGDDFKVVNLADDSTAGLGQTGPEPDATVDDADELMGIDFDGNTFYGEINQSFPADQNTVALKRGGGAGTSIATTLDVCGGRAAEESITRNDDGEIVGMELDEGGFPAHNGGLMEYDPAEDGERPRRARDPQLRPDVEGQTVVVMIQRLAEIDPDYDGRAYWATIFADLEDDRAQELAEQYAEESDGKTADEFFADLGDRELLRLQPTTEFEPDAALLDDTGWVDFAGNTFDNTDPAEVEAVNTARLADDNTNCFIPEGMDVSAATPDEVTVDGDEITGFGQGCPEDLRADDE